jgi:hypothetical protein
MRLVVLLTAAVIATAAPLRAWCEATCVAPAHHAGSTAKPHCPTNETADDKAKMAAVDLDDCPIIEAARPTSFAKLDFHRGAVSTHPGVFAPSHLITRAPQHPGTRAPSHLIDPPLRI